MGEENFQTDLTAIKNTLAQFGIKLEMVYASLVGNEISKDGGLVEDIRLMKLDNKELTKRVEKVENGQTKRELYVRLLWGAAGIIATLIIKSFIKF